MCRGVADRDTDEQGDINFIVLCHVNAKHAITKKELASIVIKMKISSILNTHLKWMICINLIEKSF